MSVLDAAVQYGWHELPANPQFERLWLRNMGAGVPSPRMLEKGALRALLGREPVDTNADDWRWHVSMSRPDRVPNWDELVSAAHELRPGVVFVIGVPPRSWWLNVHPHTLHLWESRDQNLVAQWRSERRGDEPS
jgi:hypothetical protein